MDLQLFAKILKVSVFLIKKYYLNEPPATFISNHVSIRSLNFISSWAVCLTISDLQKCFMYYSSFITILASQID